MAEHTTAHLRCPYCKGAIVRFDTGRSEYDLTCEACGAGFAIDAEAGTVRSRIWNRKAARGEHEEFPLSRMRTDA